MSVHVSVEIQNAITIVTLTRPDKLNALTGEMIQAIATAHRDFAADPAQAVMLIRAEGRYFSAGADLKSDMFPDPDSGGQSGFRAWYRSGPGSMHPTLDAFEACEKPVVVAHQGPCLGGALEMSLSCDFRLAARSARYSLPEIDLGGLPGSGGMSRLTRLVGPAWARWMAIAGETVGADQALSMGLVQAVYSDESFEDEVLAFCTRLATKPREAVSAGKLAIEMIADLDRAQGRNVERLTVGSLVMGEEFRTTITTVRDRLNRRT